MSDGSRCMHHLVLLPKPQVRGLAADHDAFMRKHAIRVDTQVVDRAMALLQVGAPTLGLTLTIQTRARLGCMTVLHVQIAAPAGAATA
jgi:hypothetical protein